MQELNAGNNDEIGRMDLFQSVPNRAAASPKCFAECKCFPLAKPPRERRGDWKAGMHSAI
jgi:hypothetical protein